ncbi:MAG: TraM recognition domain-containing protein [Lachnospiraceae bacterium]|nr:TraM recognition domain-containing protein [Lachnospiraceae bacterium]
MLRAVYWFVVPGVLEIPTGEAITPSMLVWCCRIIGVIFTVLFLVLLSSTVLSFIFNDKFQYKLMRFRLDLTIDMRKNKEYLYDMKVVRNSENGEPIPFLFNDRFTHQFVEGASGTGKTSTVLLKMIWNDLVKKYDNQLLRHRAYKKMIEEGKALLVEEPNGKINPEHIQALPGYEKELAKIKEKYLDCGYTCVGPDTDMSEQIIEFCEILGFEDLIDLFDPETVDGHFKPNFKGINPYHLPDDIKEWDYAIEVATRAKMVGDVLESIFDETGSSDTYFKNVNETCTKNIGTILMVGFPIVEHREPTLRDLAKCLLKFDSVNKYVKAVENKYEGMKNPFQESIDFCKVELNIKNKAGQELFAHARGLRNILNILLAIPNIADAICYDDCVDFKRSLEEGRIALVNYGTKFGGGIAKGIGLLYMMLLHNEVKKRNFKGFLIPHFEVIDEFSMLIHPMWEETITFLRKYKVAATFAFQSNAQFAKTEYTKYMGKVIQGVGQMIIFGRLDHESGKIFSEIAGEEMVTMLQNSVSQNSLLSDSPSYTEQVREMQTAESYADVSSLRNKQFLEVHVFPIYNSTVLPPVLGKTFFVTEKEKNSVKKDIVDFSDVIENYGDVLVNRPVSEQKLKELGLKNGGFEFGINENISDDGIITQDV